MILCKEVFPIQKITASDHSISLKCEYQSEAKQKYRITTDTQLLFYHIDILSSRIENIVRSNWFTFQVAKLV